MAICDPKGGLEPAQGAERTARMSPTLRRAEALRRAAMADGEIAEAQAVESPLRHQGEPERESGIIRYRPPPDRFMSNMHAVYSGKC